MTAQHSDRNEDIDSFTLICYVTSFKIGRDTLPRGLGSEGSWGAPQRQDTVHCFGLTREGPERDEYL